MDRSLYFDNAATTPVDPRVVREMLPYFDENWGNANSIHAAGHRAHAAVERARQQLASMLNAETPEQIIFTAGATEANNWVLRAHPDTTISPFEHSSVWEPAQHLGAQVLENDGLRLTPPSQPAELISVMSTNNEIGTCWDVAELAGAAPYLHSDITQAAGKLPIGLADIHYASLSAHKFYGPKGVGALYARDGAPPPLLLGGEHEMGARAGTLNVPAIIGMGAAAKIAEQEWRQNLEHAQALRQATLEVLQTVPDHLVNGGPDASPYILSVSFLGVEGETLVIEMDTRGFAFSSGTACSTGSTEPSRVLTALGLPPQWLRGTVRISFGKWNTLESAKAMALALVDTVEQLRKLRTF